MKRTTIKITILLLLTVAIVVSCKHIIDAKEEKSIANERIQNDKLEATLIVKAAQHNLNTIALCEAVAQLEERQEIKSIAISVKDKQQEIFESLENLAEENMISVASKSTYQPEVFKYFNSEDIVTIDILDNIKDKLETQIQVLDTLRNETDDDDIELATKESIEVLKENKELTQNALESLEYTN